MTLQILDESPYGETVNSNKVGQIRASDYFVNDVTRQLDELYHSDFDFAFITADDCKAVGAHYGKPILDTDGEEIEVELKRVIVRRYGKWEMMTEEKEVEYSFDDINL